VREQPAQRQDEEQRQKQEMAAGHHEDERGDDEADKRESQWGRLSRFGETVGGRRGATPASAMKLVT